MERTKHTFKKIASALIILLMLLSLYSFVEDEPIASKDDIKESMAEDLSSEDRLNYDYASDYLKRWGITGYDTAKMKWAERLLSLYYNYEGGLPETREHAKLCAEAFLLEYYDAIDLQNKDELTDALLTCYAFAVDDPYTVYRAAEESSDYSTDMSGKFGGIGVIIEYDHEKQTLMVSSVYIDSPAEAAGIQVGDYIIGVNGHSTEELGYLNVVYEVRGEIGTPVTLTLLRGDKTVECTAIRAEVEEKTVEFSAEDGIGYVRITDFKDNTFRQFVEAIDALTALKVEGIVFDLRGNPGGYLDTVCDMVSYLIPTGKTLVSYSYKNSKPEVILSEDDVHPITGEVADHVLELPVTVICNEYTASAGEIFTASVRDYRNEGLLNAKIVGKTTYKKGVMQSGFVYSDGASITFTVAYYNPPCGENYHGIGVEPDITVENTETEDLQLTTAIAELKKLVNSN